MARKPKRPQPILTEEQKSYREVIRTLRQYLEDAELNLEHAIKRCKHVIDGERDDHAHCIICGEGFGWWCPNSPDHVCHRESEWEDGKDTGIVQLVTGELVKPPREPDNFMCCFCDMDDERK